MSKMPITQYKGIPILAVKGPKVKKLNVEEVAKALGGEIQKKRARRADLKELELVPAHLTLNDRVVEVQYIDKVYLNNNQDPKDYAPDEANSYFIGGEFLKFFANIASVPNFKTVVYCRIYSIKNRDKWKEYKK